MEKANSYPIPTTPLEKEVCNLALKEARALVARGHAPEDAARLACRGSWREWEGWVLAQLEKDSG